MTSIPLLRGHEHPCGYLPERTAQSVFVDPAAPMTGELYSALAHSGFRRSGDLVYRPACRGCRACVPVRLAVQDFRPDRSQRRCAARNIDLTAIPSVPAFSEEHYRVFTRYQYDRHGDGSMARMSRREYLEFLGSNWSSTHFVEFRDAPRRLLGVAVVDRLRDGLSAVYTFFNPSAAARSLGTFAVLWQIGETRRLGLPYLYLGYWIAASRKMAYKQRFQPLEALRDGVWCRLGAEQGG